MKISEKVCTVFLIVCWDFACALSLSVIVDLSAAKLHPIRLKVLLTACLCKIALTAVF